VWPRLAGREISLNAYSASGLLKRSGDDGLGGFELFLLAVGLSMDAFAVSVCKGLAMGRPSPGQMAVAGVWFGGFQALMPLLGYLLGSTFERYIQSVDHWIAFGLLAFIGVNMIRESRGGETGDGSGSLHWTAMLPMAVATSIDALAVGVTFAFLDVNLPWAVGSIGAVTFVLSALGLRAGGAFGERGRGRAELCGGMILILLGLHILLEHLGLL